MRFPSSLIQFGVVLSGSIALAASPPNDSGESFARANQEYAAGKFKEAIADYEAAGQAGNWKATVFYDLGNAYFRARDFGRAILNYERAIALEPNHPEAEANLRIAREEGRSLELMPGWPDRFLRYANLNQYTMAAAVLFWISVVLFASFLFSQRRRGGVFAVAVCSVIAAALLVFLIFVIEDGPKGRSLAVVTGGATQARVATADTASSVLLLPAGSEIKVEQQRGDWVYAALPNNLRGWVPARNVEFVRL
jgi:tetratricopeptide (TPR) repeat protein